MSASVSNMSFSTTDVYSSYSARFLPDQQNAGQPTEVEAKKNPMVEKCVEGVKNVNLKDDSKLVSAYTKFWRE